MQNQKQIFGTFGLMRYLLAVMVVVTHTAPWSHAYVGQYAVFGFFLLSGYVVSYILFNQYLPAKNGLFKYTLNRFLRIYPAYACVFIFSLAVIHYFPRATVAIDKFVGWPESVGAWIASITTLGMVGLGGMPPVNYVIRVGWSLGIEIFYWALIPQLIINRKLFKGVFLFAVIYTLGVIAVSYIYGFGTVVEIRYFSLFAAALPFCIGLLIFLRRQSGGMIVSHKVAILVAVVWLVLIIFSTELFGDSFIGFYISIIVHAILTAYLSRIDAYSLPDIVRKIDIFFGNLAYPLFLLHMPISIVIHEFFPQMGTKSWEFFAWCLLVSSVFSYVLHRLVEVPVERLKDRVKRI